MTGLFTSRRGNKFVFREHEVGETHLHSIHSDVTRGACQKVGELPSGEVELFDIDDPPATVSYQPILADFT